MPKIPRTEKGLLRVGRKTKKKVVSFSKLKRPKLQIQGKPILLRENQHSEQNDPKQKLMEKTNIKESKKELRNSHDARNDIRAK